MVSRPSCHSAVRPAKQEVIYQRALAWELEQRDLQYNREIEQDIYYKELINPIGTRRADFVLEQKVLVELKLEVALLINFGSKSLTFKRLVL
jgi:GxxExxY protein